MGAFEVDRTREWETLYEPVIGALLVLNSAALAKTDCRPYTVHEFTEDMSTLYTYLNTYWGVGSAEGHGFEYNPVLKGAELVTPNAHICFKCIYDQRIFRGTRLRKPNSGDKVNPVRISWFGVVPARGLKTTIVRAPESA
jgi:hypothetical protein